MGEFLSQKASGFGVVTLGTSKMNIKEIKKNVICRNGPEPFKTLNTQAILISQTKNHTYLFPSIFCCKHHSDLY